MLPILEAVEYVGWELTRASEEDIWKEMRAMKRCGWSETTWRSWLGELDRERKTRLEWRADMDSWSMKRWHSLYPTMTGMDMSHAPISDCLHNLQPWMWLSHQSTTLFYAMVDEEADRRLYWIRWMRSHDYGEISWDEWWLTWKKCWQKLLSAESRDDWDWENFSSSDST